MKRILVTNRGEIARRIIKTINRLGHISVALKLPDEICPFYLWEAAEVLSYKSNDPRLSFLDESATIELAVANRIDLIHPGYGFLSESGTFARKVEDSNILFIGPSSDCLFKIGDKVSAKNLAIECGIPIIQGFTLKSGDIDTAYLKNNTEKLNFPLIIKASSGGGGRGMRIAKDHNSLLEMIPGARLEAKRNFGNDELFIETFLENVRHIEVQIIGDKNGSIIHLFERDCSLQRRFQKVIEIAPAPNLSEDLCYKLYESSLKLSKAAGLSNASTFEFLVDTKNQSFYFIEANPRLQVEHTITEAITGIDIVELQINSALGLSLPSQSQICKNGYAVQARICAETPEEDFSPSVGRIEGWHIAELEKDISVRCDTGYSKGETIGTNFDSLLGKVIVSGSHLDECLNKLLEQVLPVSIPLGIRTNVPFLISLLEKFSGQANIHTKWIENSFLDSYIAHYNALENSIIECAPLLFSKLIDAEKEAANNLFGKSILRPQALDQYKINLKIVSREELFLSTSHDSTVLNDINDTEFIFYPSENIGAYTGSYRGIVFSLKIDANARDSASAQMSTDLNIIAPLPGTVISLNCKSGDAVSAGTTILSIESMKIEHKLCPMENCVIEDIKISLGASVQKGEILISCKPIEVKK